MRPSTLCVTLFVTLAALFAGMLLHARGRQATATQERAGRVELVRSLGLTDLCLFTEARYTRHPAMADRHAAFQDHPMALDHFPSGSLLAPPPFPSSHAPIPPATSQRP